METSEQYVIHQGTHCPKCLSTNIQAETIEQDGARAWQNVECVACGAYWTDQYNLVGFGNFHEHDYELDAARTKVETGE